MVHITFFLFLRDHYLALSDVQCLKTRVSHILSGICFSWEDESSLSYSILGRSHTLLFFDDKRNWYIFMEGKRLSARLKLKLKREKERLMNEFPKGSSKEK